MGEIKYLKELLFSVPERIHEVCHTWPACVHQIHEDSAKSCLEVQRQVQGAAASQGINASCQEAASIPSWAGAEQVCSVQEGTKSSPAWLLVPTSGQWVPRSRMHMPCELHSQAVMPCPLFSAASWSWEGWKCSCCLSPPCIRREQSSLCFAPSPLRCPSNASWGGFSLCHNWTFASSPARTCSWICKTKLF